MSTFSIAKANPPRKKPVTKSSALEEEDSDWKSKIDSRRLAFLPDNLRKPPSDRPVRIYCDGIYDLFHFGHANSLKQAKHCLGKDFEVHLLVGVCDDKVTHAHKGKTVMTDLERYAAVSHCKWADQIIESAPWIITQEFLDAHQIDYVAHDAIPYKSGDCEDVYSFVKQQGRFLPTMRTQGISTSDLITRIVRDYDSYVRRNIERGVSAKELNISYLKEKEIQVRKGVETISRRVEENFKGTLDFWEEASHEFVRGFTSLFDGNTLQKFLIPLRRQSIITTSPSSDASPSSTQPSSSTIMMPLSSSSKSKKRPASAITPSVDTSSSSSSSTASYSSLTRSAFERATSPFLQLLLPARPRSANDAAAATAVVRVEKGEKEDKDDTNKSDQDEEESSNSSRKRVRR